MSKPLFQWIRPLVLTFVALGSSGCWGLHRHDDYDRDHHDDRDRHDDHHDDRHDDDHHDEH